MSREREQARYQYLPVPSDVTDGELVSKIAEYFDQECLEYDHFDASVERRRLYHTAIDALVLKEVALLQGVSSLLSFGCGTGRREEILRGRLATGLELYGVEFSRGMANLARARGLQVFPDLKVAGAKIPGSTVDVALCLYSFVHLTSPSERADCLSGLRRLLRPGGILLLDVFNLHDRYEWPSKLSDGGFGDPPALSGVRRGDALYRRCDRPFLSFMHYFTVGEIATLIEDCGFRVRHVTGVGHGFHPGQIGLPLDAACIFLSAVAQ